MKKTYQTPWLETLTTEAEDIIRTSANDTYKTFSGVEDNNASGDKDYVSWKW